MTPDEGVKRQLNVRLSTDEEARAERLAAHYGLGPADVVRMLLKREEDRLFSGRATWRRVAEMIFEDHAAGRETSGDRIAIALHLRWQKARNVGLLLASKNIIKETTQGDPNEPPRRTFTKRYATLEKTIDAIRDAGIDPDEEV